MRNFEITFPIFANADFLFFLMAKYHENNTKNPHKSADFSCASFLSTHFGGDYRTRICDLLRVKYYVSLLKARHKKVIQMFYFDEMTPDEVAETLQVTVRYAHSIKSNAINELVSMYEYSGRTALRKFRFCSPFVPPFFSKKAHFQHCVCSLFCVMIKLSKIGDASRPIGGISFFAPFFRRKELKIKVPERLCAS